MFKVITCIFSMIVMAGVVACSKNSDTQSSSSSNNTFAAAEAIKASALTMHSLQEYQSLCDRIAALESTPMDAGGSSSLTTETLIGTVTTYGTLTSQYGTVLLSGDPNANPRGSIQEIDDEIGTVIVCHLDIGTLKHGNGTVVVIGGNVGSLDHGNGTLVMVGGSITGSITNSGNGTIQNVQ